MTIDSVLAVTPADDAWVADYLPVGNALVARHGGKYLARTAGSVGRHFLPAGQDGLS